jgi:hypothetical protein
MLNVLKSKNPIDLFQRNDFLWQAPFAGIALPGTSSAADDQALSQHFA